MQMVTMEEVSRRVSMVLQDSLGVDEDEIKPHASISRDLGAESIDSIDIAIRLGKAFPDEKNEPLEIPRNELFVEYHSWLQWKDFPGNVEDKKITKKGIDELRKLVPVCDMEGVVPGMFVHDVQNAVVTVRYLEKFMLKLLEKSSR